MLSVLATSGVISIHTFLAEGDDEDYFEPSEFDEFQSTPSLRKVTSSVLLMERHVQISIHTFLAEGDNTFPVHQADQEISIHTFLAEGDVEHSPHLWMLDDISIHTFLAEGDVVFYAL